MNDLQILKALRKRYLTSPILSLIVVKLLICVNKPIDDSFR